jgi:hypothetical protein
MLFRGNTKDSLRAMATEMGTGAHKELGNGEVSATKGACLCFVFLAVLGFELRALHLLGVMLVFS